MIAVYLYIQPMYLHTNYFYNIIITNINTCIKFPKRQLIMKCLSSKCISLGHLPSHLARFAFVSMYCALARSTSLVRPGNCFNICCIITDVGILFCWAVHRLSNVSFSPSVQRCFATKNTQNNCCC